MNHMVVVYQPIRPDYRAAYAVLIPELQIIVFPPVSGKQRTVKCRMSADGKISRFLRKIIHPPKHFQFFSVQTVSDLQFKVKRIHFLCLFIGIQRKPNLRSLMGNKLKLHIPCKSMFPHRIGFPLETIFPFFQHTDEREQNRRCLSPICRIAAPHILRSFFHAAQRLQFRAVAVNGCRNFSVADFTNCHTFSPSVSVFPSGQ